MKRKKVTKEFKETQALEGLWPEVFNFPGQGVKTSFVGELDDPENLKFRILRSDGEAKDFYAKDIPPIFKGRLITLYNGMNRKTPNCLLGA